MNPIRLVASSTPQYIHSPYDVKSRMYLPKSDCKFLISSKSAKGRVQLTVISSDLEEPLFSRCNDFCSLRDGRKAEEICGGGH